MSFEVELNTVIVDVGHDGFCKCDASTRCPLGKVGTQPRCSHDELLRNLFKVRYPAGYKHSRVPMVVLISGEAK